MTAKTFCALLSVAAVSLLNAADFTVAVRGEKPAACVIVPGDPGPSRRHAAKELVKYVQLMTGVRLPEGKRGEGLREIVIAADPGRSDDGFSITCRDGRLVLSGSEKRGALYAVYALLERWGVVFCSADYEKVPRLDGLKVPDGLSVEETPAFDFREFIYLSALDPAYSAKLARNVMTWGRMTPEYGGKELTASRGLAGHTFEKLVPPKEFFASHPEYFSEVKGVRTGVRSQLCLTNPDVLDIVTARVLKAMRAEPQAKVFSVSPNDWYNHCMCVKCRAVDDREGSPVGSYLAFLNALARRTAKEFPDRYIGASAYMHTRRPPKTMRVEKNVVFSLSPIECDYYRPLDRSGYSENVRAVDEIRRWASLGGGVFGYTDYTVNFSHYPLAFPNLDSLSGTLMFCRSAGVRGICDLGAHDSIDAFMQELRVWVFAKLAWNPRRDTWKLVRTFADAYYGAAADVAVGYLKGLHALPRDSSIDPLKLHEGFLHPSVPDGFLDKAYAEWTKAERNPALGKAELEHVKAAKFSVVYHLLGRHLGKVCVSTDADKAIRIHEAAKWLVGYVESRGRDMIVAEHRGPFAGSGMFRVWKEFACSRPVSAASGRGEAEEDLFILYGSENDRPVVDDPQAGNGKAVRIAPGCRNWVVQMNLSDVRTDPGAMYRFKIRAKPDECAIEERNKVVFRAGVCTRGGSAEAAGNVNRRFTADETSAGIYRWYDVGSFKPMDDKYIWISAEGPGGLSVDRIAICKEVEVPVKNTKKAHVIPAPSARVVYGGHPLQYVELWLPEDVKPQAGGWPLAVYIHGGGWTSGKAVDTVIAPRLSGLLERGIAVASVSYRLFGDLKGVKIPLSAVIADITAGVRKLRSEAGAYGVDVSRIGFVGGSAGACSALQLALTRGNFLGVRFVAALYPQTTLDPKEMKEWVPSQGKYGAHAFGLTWEEFTARRGELMDEISKYSPAALARRIDPRRAPEIVMEYPPANFPKQGTVTVKDPVHSGQFGIAFERLCRERGIRCELFKGPCDRPWNRLADALLKPSP